MIYYFHFPLCKIHFLYNFFWYKARIFVFVNLMVGLLDGGRVKNSSFFITLGKELYIFRKSVTFSPLFAYVYMFLVPTKTNSAPIINSPFQILIRKNGQSSLKCLIWLKWRTSKNVQSNVKGLFRFGSLYQKWGYRVSASPSSLNCKLLPMASCVQHFIFICPELSTLRILEHMNSIPQLNTNNEAGMVKNMRKSHRAWCRLNLATTKSELSGV